MTHRGFRDTVDFWGRFEGSVMAPLLGVCLIASTSLGALAADTITGVARNQTLGLPAVGDDVILLGLDQRMEEESRTQTDPHGSFTFIVRDSGKLHLVRIVHQGVNYDQKVSVGTSVSVNVFDTAAEVQGVTGSIEIIRIGANGNLLHVSDMVEVRNDSSPPVTKSGKRTFEIYLPARARIDSVLAAGSDKIGVMISAAPLLGEPGHYAVNFPLRPGATKFAFNYDLLYDGRAIFHTRSAVSLQQLAVMIPPTMKFTSRSSRFQMLATDNDSYQVEAANQVQAGEGPGFEISGTGTLPALPAKTAKPPVASLPAPALSSSNSFPAQGPIVKSPDAAPASSFLGSSSHLGWFLLGAGSVLLPGGLGFCLRRRQRRSALAIMPAAISRNSSLSVIETLKEEMFQLEIERLQGTISPEEYASAKRALEATVTRALARAPSGNGHPTPSITAQSQAQRLFSIKHRT